MSDFNIKLGVKLDEQSLSKIKSDLEEINIHLDLGSTLVKDISKLKSNIKNEFSNIGKESSNSFNKNFDLQYSGKQIDNIKDALKNIKIDNSSIEKVISDLEEMHINLTKIRASTKSNDKSIINISGIDEAGRQIDLVVKKAKDGSYAIDKSLTVSFKEQAKTADQAVKSNKEYIQSTKELIKAKTEEIKEKTATSQQKAATQERIQSLELEKQKTLELRQETERLKQERLSNSINNQKLDSTKLTADINTLRNNIKLFLQENKTLSVETENSINDLMNNLNNVNSAKGLTTIRAQYKEIQSSAKLAGETGKRSFEQMELEAKKFTSSQITLSSKIDNILNNNTKLTAAYREQYEVLKKRNLEATDKKEISSINAEVNALTAQAKAAGLLGNTWSSEIKNVLSQFKGMFSAVAIFSTLKSGVQTSFNEILSLDDAMVELKKVCDSTNASFEEFYYSSNGMAKSLGQTTESIIEQTSAWSQMG